ncbi:insulin gene enhancer protein ISL-1-like isoform X2 [Limulus polyphemus]|uniref:Insulin gene enhancer protein ISL-1-like isoform X2 n=1 Tax=Limulus polyphemus TaxID=6850 RepID=A0ABM1S2D5_LIMPO|nr:insulin gene enhancer protein ISL-1-like isoform X2 [Limulus polyphemus]
MTKIPTAKISPSKAGEAAGMGEAQALKRRRVSTCVGCGSQINDQYILRVAPDLEWHAACLKCADCHQFLDETCTCFVRDGKTYCKRDYVRLFGAKCAKCNSGFNKDNFVMRARNKIYHLECFQCMACSRQLVPGDEFALRDDGLFCKADHEVLEKANNNNNSIPLNGKGNNSKANDSTGLQMAANAEPMQTNRNRSSVRPHVHKQSSDVKSTRVRTVLNEKQLHTLRTCYAANPRPDALMKEQLVEMTGLSPRVIRVWFQNKRCKDKKKSIMMKQMQQQDKFVILSMSDSDCSPQHSPEGRQVSLGTMRGVPMVASSPVRHESPLQVNPIEVQTYHPPWKTLTEYAMQPVIDPNTPHFQQLVNQMHGYGSDPHNDPTQQVPVTMGPPVSAMPPPPPYLGPGEDPLHTTHLPPTPSDLSSPNSE